MTAPIQPSSSDATLGHYIDLADGRRARACWFPSMGGYAGKALIVPPQRDGECCTEVWVWHDGAFPFSSDPGDHSRWPGEDMPSPVRLTIHGGQDFVAFGRLVDECESAADAEEQARDYSGELGADGPEFFMTLSRASECVCDLIDVSSSPEKPEFVRGMSNGCKVHPSERWDAIEAAKRKAREA